MSSPNWARRLVTVRHDGRPCRAVMVVAKSLGSSAAARAARAPRDAGWQLGLAAGGGMVGLPGDLLVVAVCDGWPEVATSGALGELRERLDGYFKHRAYPGWFDRWSDIEAEAKVLRTFQLVAVPGLLQTDGYAQAMLRTQVMVTGEE